MRFVGARKLALSLRSTANEAVPSVQLRTTLPLGTSLLTGQRAHLRWWLRCLARSKNVRDARQEKCDACHRFPSNTGRAQRYEIEIANAIAIAILDKCLDCLGPHRKPPCPMTRVRELTEVCTEVRRFMSRVNDVALRSRNIARRSMQRHCYVWCRSWDSNPDGRLTGRF